jgi:hypothetical protein
MLEEKMKKSGKSKLTKKGPLINRKEPEVNLIPFIFKKKKIFDSAEYFKKMDEE